MWIGHKSEWNTNGNGTEKIEEKKMKKKK